MKMKYILYQISGGGTHYRFIIAPRSVSLAEIDRHLRGDEQIDTHTWLEDQLGGTVDIIAPVVAAAPGVSDEQS